MIQARAVYGSFGIAIIVLILSTAISKGNPAWLFALLFLYLFCYASQFVLLFLNKKFSHFNSLIIYPLTCLATIISFVFFLAWLSGNNAGEIASDMLFDSKMRMGVMAPYIVGSIVSYGYLIYEIKFRAQA